METVKWREIKNSKIKMINLEWKGKLEKAGISVSELIGEIIRLEKIKKQKRNRKSLQQEERKNRKPEKNRKSSYWGKN